MDEPSIDLAVHERDGSRLLFLANPTSHPKTGTLTWPGVDLGPHDVQLFEVRPC